MKLYSYWRSSAAYRVRIALNLKGLEFDYLPVDLRKAEQYGPEYDLINGQHLVPTLVDGDLVIGQSLAIVEYLEERVPDPGLLPAGAGERALARQIALTIAAEVHPLNNLRVLQYLKRQLAADESARTAWYHHWLGLGLDAAERLVDETGPYALGRELSLADLFIVPQLYNARRYDFPLDAYPRLRRIDAACLTLEPFDRALPEHQPDAAGS